MRRFALLSLLILIGCGQKPTPKLDIEHASWPEIEQAARGQTVYWTMWRGDPAINRYIDGFIAPKLKADYDITLQPTDGQGAAIVSTLTTERQAGAQDGSMDLVWINGETFAQLRQTNALHGPWTERLPNNRLIDWQNPIIATDFEQPVAGYEMPWGNVQMAIIYDSLRTPVPPRTFAALMAYAKAHPGRVTYDRAFTGLTFIKALVMALTPPDSLRGPFDQATYDRASQKAWAYLNEIKPFLWRRGETYPDGVPQLHSLFANGEIDFSMSNNDDEVDNKVLQGVLPKTAKAYVFESGTIQNTHYLGIPVNAPHKAAAMVTANLLASPEAQFEKAKPAVWGDGTVLDVQKLPADWQARFAAIPGRTRAPSRAEIQPHALAELRPEYMTRLAEDWRRFVLKAP